MWKTRGNLGYGTSANPEADQRVLLCQPWLILGLCSNHVWLSQVLPETRISRVLAGWDHAWPGLQQVCHRCP